MAAKAETLEAAGHALLRTLPPDSSTFLVLHELLSRHGKAWDAISGASWAKDLPPPPRRRPPPDGRWPERDRGELLRAFLVLVTDARAAGGGGRREHRLATTDRLRRLTGMVFACEAAALRGGGAPEASGGPRRKCKLSLRSRKRDDGAEEKNGGDRL